MVCKSQYIPVCELLECFVPSGSKGLLVLLRGYFDESYNERVFTYSCAMSDTTGWADIERGWKLCLKAKNKELKADGRREISRYHAADCSSLVGEFKGWTVPEQIAFTK